MTFTCCVAISAKLPMTAAHSFLLISVAVESAHEGHEGCQGHDQEWPRRGAFRCNGDQKKRVRGSHGQPGRNCPPAGEECWQVRAAWSMHYQDTPEAGDKGRQEGGLREGRHCQGQASENRGEGFPGVGFEEEHLS